jgi:membrane-associated phospholipid phosphatase
VVALVIVNVFGGSQLLRSLIICNIAGLATLGFINIYWLISNHTASMMLATLFVGFTFSVTASIALIPLVGLVFWARFLLGRHTVAQLIAGLFVGAAPVLILTNFGYIN